MADVKHQAKDAIDTTADKAKDLTERAADAAGRAQEKAKEWAGDAYDAARDAGQRVQRWAGETYDVAADRVGDFGNEAAALIRRHPLPAVLIGFGIGVLLGRARVI
jgi:ElaB/YqjD/DUF883 family membrane-anchored ribosome-binding protein